MSLFKAEQLKFKLPSGKIAALAWGNKSGSPILALHGWLDNAASFTPMALFLAKHNFRVIAIDFLGHGLSMHKSKGLHVCFSDYIVDIVFLIEQLTAQLGVNNLVLMGHSLGGAIASLVAGSTPQHISHLILLDSLGPLAIKAEHTAEQMGQAIAQYKKLNLKRLPRYATLDEAIKARLRATPMSEAAVKILLERGLKYLVAEKTYCWRTDPRLLIKPILMLLEEQIEDFLAKITVPTCVVRPTSGWPFSEEVFKQRCQKIKDLTIHYLQGHHHVHMDSPEIVANLIHNFLINKNNG